MLQVGQIVMIGMTVWVVKSRSESGGAQIASARLISAAFKTSSLLHRHLRGWESLHEVGFISDRGHHPRHLHR